MCVDISLGFLFVLLHFHQEALWCLFAFCHRGGVVCVLEATSAGTHPRTAARQGWGRAWASLTVSSARPLAAAALTAAPGSRWPLHTNGLRVVKLSGLMYLFDSAVKMISLQHRGYLRLLSVQGDEKAAAEQNSNS